MNRRRLLTLIKEEDMKPLIIGKNASTCDFSNYEGYNTESAMEFLSKYILYNRVNVADTYGDQFVVCPIQAAAADGSVYASNFKYGNGSFSIGTSSYFDGQKPSASISLVAYATLTMSSPSLNSVWVYFVDDGRVIYRQSNVYTTVYTPS